MIDLSTSRFQNGDGIVKHQEQHGSQAYRITRKPPQYGVKGYRICGNYSPLAPAPAIFRLSGDKFGEAYLEQLDRLGIDTVLKDLDVIGKACRTNHLILLCFENVRDGDNCHRRRFADWYRYQTGFEVPEIEDLGPRKKGAKAAKVEIPPATTQEAMF